MTEHLNNKKTKLFPSSQNKFSAPEASTNLFTSFTMYGLITPHLLPPKVKIYPRRVNRVEGKVTLQQVCNPFAFATFCTAVHNYMGHDIDGMGKLRKKAETPTTLLSLRQGNDVCQSHRPTRKKVPVALILKYSQFLSSHVVRAKKTISLIKRGGHIGHNAASTLQPRLRHPQSLQLLLGKRGRGDMACLSISVDQAARGLYLVARVLQHGGHVLLVDTRDETSPLQRFVEARASFLPPSLSFGGQHWIGGTLTNWNSISKTVFRCAQISNQFDTFLVSNRVHLPRYEKMRKSYLGFLQHYQSTHCLQCDDQSVTNPYIVNDVNRLVKDWSQHHHFANKMKEQCEKIGKDKIGKNTMHQNNRNTSVENREMARDRHTDNVKLTGHPDLLVVINPAENRQIIKESERLGIPVVGVIDSNDNLHGITVPVLINPGSLLQPDSFGIRVVQLAIDRERFI